MAADVGEDAAELIAVVEPVRPALAAGEMGAVFLAVRAEAQGLHDPADPTIPDKLSAGLNGAWDLRSATEKVTDQKRPDAATVFSRSSSSSSVDTAGLVGHDVLAVAQRGHRDCGTAVGHRAGTITSTVGSPSRVSGSSAHTTSGQRSTTFRATAADLSSREDAHQLATLAQ